MMELTKPSSKLSVLAMFDDMCRFANSVTSSDAELIGLLQNYEENRIKMIQYKNDITTKDQIIDKLQTENRQLKTRLQSIRLAFTREVNAKESIMKDYKQLRSKWNVIQDMLNEEQRNVASKSSMSVLSDINLIVSSRPSGAAAQCDNPNLNISNDSLDELLFDKSDDNLDDEQQRTMECTIRKREQTIYSVVQKSKNNLTNITNTESTINDDKANEPAAKKCCSTIDEVDEETDEGSDLNYCFISSDENAEKTITIPKQLTESNIGVKPNHNSAFYPLLSSKSQANAVSSQFSSTDCHQRNKLVRHHSSNITKMNLLRSASRLEPERLTTREHSFQQKKAFRPVVCTPCGKNIGFCSNFLVCIECRGVAHPRCRNDLPRPCLPYVTGAGLRKMTSATLANGMFTANQSHILMIGDFTPLNTRPCVPALLVHCCNEIDRRIDMALNDPKVKSDGVDSSPVVGLYRICGIDRDVRELRTKILESKNGIPNLTNISDVHVLCGTVKLFLRDLDDPLVTRILWHDFCRAADHVEQNAPDSVDENGIDSDYGSRGEELDTSHDEFYESIQILKEVILQLPNANRDSMAFLFLHFRHIIDSQAVTKMNARSLAKIFAPTMIGSAVPRTSMSSFANDNIKQISIMAALFRISRNFWHGLLNDPNFCPFKELSQNGEQLSHQTKRKSLTFAKNISSTSLANLINQNKNDNNKLAGNLKHGIQNHQNQFNRTTLNEIY